MELDLGHGLARLRLGDGGGGAVAARHGLLALAAVLHLQVAGAQQLQLGLTGIQHGQHIALPDLVAGAAGGLGDIALERRRDHALHHALHGGGRADAIGAVRQRGEQDQRHHGQHQQLAADVARAEQAAASRSSVAALRHGPFLAQPLVQHPARQQRHALAQLNVLAVETAPVRPLEQQALRASASGAKGTVSTWRLPNSRASLWWARSWMVRPSSWGRQSVVFWSTASSMASATACTRFMFCTRRLLCDSACTLMRPSWRKPMLTRSHSRRVARSVTSVSATS